MKYFPNSFIFLRYGTFLCLQITTKRVSQFILLLIHPTRFGNDTKWQGAMWIRICNMTFRIGNMQIINWSDSPLTFYSLYLSFNRHSFSKLCYTFLYLLFTLKCTHYHLCFFLLSKAKNRTKLSLNNAKVWNRACCIGDFFISEKAVHCLCIRLALQYNTVSTGRYQFEGMSFRWDFNIICQAQPVGCWEPSTFYLT